MVDGPYTAYTRRLVNAGRDVPPLPEDSEISSQFVEELRATCVKFVEDLRSVCMLGHDAGAISLTELFYRARKALIEANDLRTHPYVFDEALRRQNQLLYRELEELRQGKSLYLDIESFDEAKCAALRERWACEYAALTVSEMEESRISPGAELGSFTQLNPRVEVEVGFDDFTGDDICPPVSHARRYMGISE